MSTGWVSIHRKLQDNPIWTSEPFTRGQAWVDLILLANHERGYIYVRDHKIEIERGQVGWSQNRLANRWQWSRTKVRKFLQDLEKEQQIKQEKSKSYTVITLINYDEYQSEKQQENKSKTSEKQQENTNNNVNNENNDNKKEYTPDLEDVIKYFTDSGYTKESAKKFYNYYQTSIEGTQKRYWRDSKGNKVRNWKQKAQAVWFKEENEIQSEESLFDNNKLRGING